MNNAQNLPELKQATTSEQATRTSPAAKEIRHTFKLSFIALRFNRDLHKSLSKQDVNTLNEILSKISPSSSGYFSFEIYGENKVEPWEQ